MLFGSVDRSQPPQSLPYRQRVNKGGSFFGGGGVAFFFSFLYSGKYSWARRSKQSWLICSSGVTHACPPGAQLLGIDYTCCHCRLCLGTAYFRTCERFGITCTWGHVVCPFAGYSQWNTCFEVSTTAVSETTNLGHLYRHSHENPIRCSNKSGIYSTASYCATEVCFLALANPPHTSPAHRHPTSASPPAQPPAAGKR